MPATAPITVGIPTYKRGDKVLHALKCILACDPQPEEILVHVDVGDGGLEGRIKEAFPSVHVLVSSIRVGPGGGRHRMLQAATQPIFCSFDDDSWPVDTDYFARVAKHFDGAPKVAVLEAQISHRNQPVHGLAKQSYRTTGYTGCGHGMRVIAYRMVTGYVDRPNAYGLEELDVSLQLHSAGWDLLKCADLRVFHDTDLAHHSRPEIISSTVENSALLTWLRYPVVLWPYGLLQYANVIRFMVLNGRLKGVMRGVLNTPLEVWRHRHLRKSLPAEKVLSYLRLRHQHVC